MKRVFSVFVSVLIAAVVILPSFTPVLTKTGVNGIIEADAASGSWIGAWATAPIEATVSVGTALNLQDVIFSRSTTRTEVTVTTGGTLLRIKVSNIFGDSDLKITQASIAKTNTDVASGILENTSVGLTFNNGSSSVTVDNGDEIWSDPVYFETKPLDRLSISFYYASRTRMSTCGLFGGKTFLSTSPTIVGNASQVNSLKLDSPAEVSIGSSTITYHTVPFLTNIDVFSRDPNAYTAVVIGDSTLTNNNHIYLATKLVNAGFSNIGLINQSIVANRLLYDGVGLIGSLYGEALIDRFERDALTQSNVKVVLVKIGLNDCIHPATKSMAGKAPYSSVDDIIQGYKELISMAHARGIKIYMFKKTAWNGYQRSFLGQSDDLSWSQDLQDMCDKLDAWIVSTPLLDGYIDLDALDDPLDHTALLPAFTSDGAHLTDLGAIYCADLIPLSIFGIKRDVMSASKIIGVDPIQAKQDRIDAANAPTNPPTHATVAEPAQSATQPSGGQNTPNTDPVQSSKPSTSTPGNTSGFNSQTQTTAPSETGTTADGAELTVSVPTADASQQQGNPTPQSIDVPPAGDSAPTVDTVNNGAKIGLVLVIVLVVVVAGAIVVLSLGRKKVDGEI